MLRKKISRLHHGMLNRITKADGLPDRNGKPVKRRVEKLVGSCQLVLDGGRAAAADL